MKLVTIQSLCLLSILSRYCGMLTAAFSIDIHDLFVPQTKYFIAFILWSLMIRSILLLVLIYDLLVPQTKYFIAIILWSLMLRSILLLVLFAKKCKKNKSCRDGLPPKNTSPKTNETSHNAHCNACTDYPHITAQCIYCVATIPTSFQPHALQCALSLVSLVLGKFFWWKSIPT